MISNLANLVARRDLLRELVLSELRAGTAETRLGWLWWFLDPLLHMVIYWAIVVVIFARGKVQYEPYPMFILVALITWKHFAASAGGATKILASKESLIKSIPFPTMVLPLARVLCAFAYFCFGFVVVILSSLVFPSVKFTGNYLTIIQVPLLMILQIFVVTGVALGIACFGVLLRDLASFMTHLLRVGFYLSPGLYGIDMVRDALAEKLGPSASMPSWVPENLPQVLFAVYLLNPFAILINGYRRAVLWGEWIPASYWLTLTVEAAVVFFIGYRIFQHYDRRVIKFL